MMASAWFGAWMCGCTDIETQPQKIADQCPSHREPLIVDMQGNRRVRLNHSGVSGYGIRDANGVRL